MELEGLPVGVSYTGSFNRLFFVACKDDTPHINNGYFRNVKIFEEGDCESILRAATCLEVRKVVKVN